MTNLTEDDCKVLTSLIGECWHERKVEDSWLPVLSWSSCKICNEIVKIQSFDRHTFTSGNDMMLVKEAIEKMGKWDKFQKYIHHEWINESYVGNKLDYLAWAINPTTFCKLAADWWRKKKT